MLYIFAYTSLQYAMFGDITIVFNQIRVNVRVYFSAFQYSPALLFPKGFLTFSGGIEWFPDDFWGNRSAAEYWKGLK